MNRPRWLSRPHKLVDTLQIVVFGNQDEGQEARSGEAARNRAARCRTLDHPFAAAAGLLQPRHRNHFNRAPSSGLRSCRGSGLRPRPPDAGHRRSPGRHRPGPSRAAHAVCRGKPGDGGGVPWQVLPKLQDRALCPRSRVRAQVSPRPQAICNPASASSSCSISRANICELAPNFWRLSLGDLQGQGQGLHQEIMRVASCPATEGPAPSGLRDHQAGRTR